MALTRQDASASFLFIAPPRFPTGQPKPIAGTTVWKCRFDNPDLHGVTTLILDHSFIIIQLQTGLTCLLTRNDSPEIN
ncbi:MAG TPA: hypothetical protein ENH53_05415 [Bacteroidetes bacterium]|nr:hypothetical protein [Bacteroidota bacterium]